METLYCLAFALLVGATVFAAGLYVLDIYTAAAASTKSSGTSGRRPLPNGWGIMIHDSGIAEEITQISRRRVPISEMTELARLIQDLFDHPEKYGLKRLGKECWTPDYYIKE
jgi:hypothetical protein